MNKNKIQIILLLFCLVFVVLFIWLFRPKAKPATQDTAVVIAPIVEKVEVITPAKTARKNEEPKVEKPIAETPKPASEKLDYEKIAADFRAKYKAALADPNLIGLDKRDELDRIAKEFVQKVGITRAMNEVPNLLGPGDDRLALYRSLFLHAKENITELATLLRDPSNDEETHLVMWRGLRDNLIKKGPDLKELQTLLPLAEVEKKDSALARLVSEAIGKSGKTGFPQYMLDDAVQFMKLAYPSADEFNEQMKEFCSWYAKDVKDENFEEYIVFSSGIYKRPNEKRIFASILQQKLDQNPTNGMQHVLNLDRNHPGIIEPAVLNDLMFRFIKKDSNAANLWYEENKDKLTPSAKEHIMEAFAEKTAYSNKLDESQKWLDEMSPGIAKDTAMINIAESVSDTNIVEAWKWVNKITDPEARKQAEGKVWWREKQMVNEEVQKAPEEFLIALTNGTSEHKDYWIEEAMNVWLNNDFDAANKWYQKNWKTLPKDKAQYAAASFATQAIIAGDINSANQWIGYISDPKTKQRIQGDLEKVQK